MDPVKQNRWPLLFIPLAALILILPLLYRGASCGHDFNFHLVSWLEVAWQWGHGTLHPRWAFTPAYGAGEPRFIFYPPFSWILGGLLTLLLPIKIVPAVYSFLVLTGCGFSMRHLARLYVEPQAALFAAVLYMANPYMLFVIYERTAYGEFLAAAFLPLLLHAILRERISPRAIAICIALLWYSNAPAAVMGTYAFVVIALVRAAMQYRSSRNEARVFALKSAAGLGLGFALAAFYLVPAIVERRWVQIEMAMVPGMRIADNFLFHHTPDADHDAVLRTASWIAIFFFLWIAAAAWWNWRDSTRQKQTVPLLALAALLFFLLTPLSAFAWHLLPQLAFLQFPWRWLAVLSMIAVLLIAMAMPARVKILLPAAAVLVCLLTLHAKTFFYAICYPEDTATATKEQFFSGKGFDPTDEYTPRTADNDSLKQSLPLFWLTNGPDDMRPPPRLTNEAEPRVYTYLHQPYRWSLGAALDHPQYLVLKLRDYPAWQVRVNKTLVTSRPERDDGLLTIPLPQGDSFVDVRYSKTYDQYLGKYIALGAIVLLLWPFYSKGAMEKFLSEHADHKASDSNG